MEYLGNCSFHATTRSKHIFCRFWNESRCNRKFSGIEKCHSKFCTEIFDEVFFGILPPPPLLPPPPMLYNLIAGAGDQKKKPKDVGRSREYENADEINSKYSRGSVHLALSKSLRASPNNKRPAAKAIDAGNMGCQVSKGWGWGLQS